MSELSFGDEEQTWWAINYIILPKKGNINYIIEWHFLRDKIALSRHRHLRWQKKPKNVLIFQLNVAHILL